MTTTADTAKTRAFWCNICHYHGVQVASCVATITGCMGLEKETVVLSVCPHCRTLASSLQRVYDRKTQ
jgi:hypothetical protein